LNFLRCCPFRSFSCGQTKTVILSRLIIFNMVIVFYTLCDNFNQLFLRCCF
jgi:hypothetical protein